MQEFFEWFTHMEHTKPFVLVLFFVTFIGILVYVFWGKQRSERIENHKFIPLDDDDDN
ncbi:MAG: cbb3-type cytochrome c oxidase subunit 3 [Gammaproteobacteria bacterium]